MTSFDLCSWCDGQGTRDWLSGAPCYHCGGSGMVELGRLDDDWGEEDDGWFGDELNEAEPQQEPDR